VETDDFDFCNWLIKDVGVAVVLLILSAYPFLQPTNACHDGLEASGGQE
jgi:hypothetical protein